MLCCHRPFLFAVVLLSYLYRESTAIKSNIPPDTVILKEGEPLWKGFFSYSDTIYFVCPNDRTNINYTIVAYTSPFEVTVTPNQYGSYWYDFRRPNTVFGDTGWYIFSLRPITNIFSDAVIRFYVYVESEPVRFVEQARSHPIVAHQGEDIIIPCRPTSPNVVVQIKRSVRGKNGDNEINPRWNFDPKIGFILYEDDIDPSGLYICTIDPYQEVSYNVIVSGYNRLPKPIINDSSDSLNVWKGQSLFLKCAIIIPKGVDYHIFWIVTQRSDRMNTSTESRIINDTSVEKMVLLKITNVTCNDSGFYECRVMEDIYQEKSKAYVEVHDGPLVYMNKPRLYYSHNQVVKINCYAQALSKPNITWIYRKCPNYPFCDDATVEYLTNFKESEIATYLVSTVWMTIEMSGELTCRACDILDCRTATERVSVSDKFAGFGIVTKDPVAEGDEWELICAASIHYYLDYFDWSSETGRVVQSDRISIVREKTESMYRSILKIQNVTVEDSQEYICTAMSTDNRTLSDGYRLEVKVARAPFFINTNMRNDEITVDLTILSRKIVYFQCFADGMPKPNISWFKDDIQLVAANAEYKFVNNSQILELDYPLEVDSGVYVCRVENRIGKVEVFRRITIIDFIITNDKPVGLILLVAILTLAVLILVIYFANRIRRERIMKMESMVIGSMHVGRGANENTNQNLYVEDPTNRVGHF